MTLRRYIPVKDESEDAGLRMVRFDDGAWMRAADVLAWRDSIRAAVEALLAAPLCRCTSLPHYTSCEFGQAYNTLDALLGNDPGEP